MLYPVYTVEKFIFLLHFYAKFLLLLYLLQESTQTTLRKKRISCTYNLITIDN